ncbi:hypothetical protein JB92DRAFT_3131256 [Gautieria morchelliformis]|nr:hypothetical protein JB92DRAFT_3131256 [Gautieria morchelliformis]
MAIADLLGLLSAITSFTKSKDSSCTLPFGGKLNIILVRDFHQFPPPKRASSALYRSSLSTMYWGGIGQNVFRQFKTVVLLKEQKRIDDTLWANILERSRYKACTEPDLHEFHKLILTHESCQVPDFTQPPWNKVVLVTPRHGMQMEWNDAALRQHCRTSAKSLFVSPAEDTVGTENVELSLQQKLLVAASEGKEQLAQKVKLAEGMRAMLTWNLGVGQPSEWDSRNSGKDFPQSPRDAHIIHDLPKCCSPTISPSPYPLSTRHDPFEESERVVQWSNTY